MARPIQSYTHSPLSEEKVRTERSSRQEQDQFLSSSLSKLPLLRYGWSEERQTLPGVLARHLLIAKVRFSWIVDCTQRVPA